MRLVTFPELWASQPFYFHRDALDVLTWSFWGREALVGFWYFWKHLLDHVHDISSQSDDGSEDYKYSSFNGPFKSCVTSNRNRSQREFTITSKESFSLLFYSWYISFEYCWENDLKLYKRWQTSNMKWKCFGTGISLMSLHEGLYTAAYVPYKFKYSWLRLLSCNIFLRTKTFEVIHTAKSAYETLWKKVLLFIIFGFLYLSEMYLTVPISASCKLGMANLLTITNKQTDHWKCAIQGSEGCLISDFKQAKTIKCSINQTMSKLFIAIYYF